MMIIIMSLMLIQPMSSIKLLYPDHLRLIVYDNDDDDDEFDADAADE